MPARREYRDRDEVEVAVLDALVDRGDEGLTVFELRSHVDVDIDRLEAALSGLKRDDLITADASQDPTVIRVDDRVVPAPDEPVDTEDDSLIDRVRDRLKL